ncbi:MAG: HDIG domain-containing protein [Deltaproteobacteria bacterium]|nr:HDIG domain-containing protein [Deltaproteobacteria bacterium]
MNRADVFLDKILLNARKLLKSANLFDNKNSFKHYRTVVLLVMAFLVTILLSPRLNITMPSYKMGMVAKKDIVATHDFSVFDRKTHELEKVEVLKGVNLVYDYNPDVTLAVYSRLRNTLPVFGKLYQQLLSANGAERDVTIATAREEIEESLAITLTDDEYAVLFAQKFHPRLLENVRWQLEKAYGSNILIADLRPEENEIHKGIKIRDSRTQRETIKKSWDNIRDIEDARLLLAQNINTALAGEAAGAKKTVLSIASRMLQPALVYNLTASEKLKEEAIASIPLLSFKVLQGEIIVREGERITETDIDEIAAMTKNSQKNRLPYLLLFCGTFAVVLLFSSVMYLVSREWLGKQEDGDRAVLFIAICLILQVFLTRTGIFISSALSRAFPLLPAEVFFHAIPFATTTLVVALLTNRNLAINFAIVASVLSSSFFENKLTIASMSMLGGIIAAYHIVQCHHRSAFFRSGFILGVLNAVLIIAFAMVTNNLFSLTTLLTAVMGILGGFITAFLVAGFVPIMESSFGYITNIRLLELGNLNNPIFQRMILEAPGTYNHSIIVASMVEAAAETTGANPMLAKTAAFYHDIGKVKKPSYFIENNREGENPHDKLSPKMSSAVIIAHVKEGYEMAEKIGLPRAIAEIIRQHHGTSQVRFFFNKAKNDADPSIRALSEDDFRYPGPKPQSKEAALVMLADVVEASSRTLGNPTSARIASLVRERVTRIFSDGQLDECQLTMSDLYKIENIFTRVITGLFHQRIGYPIDENNKKARQKTSPETPGIMNNGNSD